MALVLVTNVLFERSPTLQLVISNHKETNEDIERRLLTEHD